MHSMLNGTAPPARDEPRNRISWRMSSLRGRRGTGMSLTRIISGEVTLYSTTIRLRVLSSFSRYASQSVATVMRERSAAREHKPA